MKKFFALIAIAIALCACENDDSLSPIEAPAVVAEFRPNLSELNLFTGDLNQLNVTPYAVTYTLNSTLFSDYAQKERFIVLPDGEIMEYNGDGLPLFPEGTIIAKTFYYNNDERDLSLGRRILETRILIKNNGDWISGDYKWNDDQTDAVLDLNGSTVAVSWIDAEGTTQNIDYQIPSNADCLTCHGSYDALSPIGPKLRNLNFNLNGSNQIQQLINDGKLVGLDNSESVASVVNWKDSSVSLEARTRTYMDINCAHCHQPGGFCDIQSTLNLSFETPLDETNISEQKNSILFRVSSYIPGVSMPFIGTTVIHTEGADLIEEYLDTL